MTLMDVNLKIYCQRHVLLSAICFSKSASGIACKLMPGVFNIENIMTCTMTEKPVRQMEKRQKKKCVILHPIAVKAITSEYFM